MLHVNTLHGPDLESADRSTIKRTHGKGNKLEKESRGPEIRQRAVWIITQQAWSTAELEQGLRHQPDA